MLFDDIIMYNIDLVQIKSLASIINIQIFDDIVGQYAASPIKIFCERTMPFMRRVSNNQSDFGQTRLVYLSQANIPLSWGNFFFSI